MAEHTRYIYVCHIVETVNHPLKPEHVYHIRVCLRLSLQYILGTSTSFLSYSTYERSVAKTGIGTRIDRAFEAAGNIVMHVCLKLVLHTRHHTYGYRHNSMRVDEGRKG